MRRIALTQRVNIQEPHGERRDCLDQAWIRLLAACGLLPILVPNLPSVALRLVADCEVSGLILTGGNDLADLGGDAPERDATEHALLDHAERMDWPVLGVCRGMQLLQHRNRIPLRRVEGHVTPRQRILIDGSPADVNSYHCFGATESRPPLEAWAWSPDGVIKAIRHRGRATVGIMWHPERNAPFDQRDQTLLTTLFGTAA